MAPKELKRLRTKIGWTQEQAARQLKVSLRTWARWEAGETRIMEAVALFVKTKAAAVRKS